MKLPRRLLPGDDTVPLFDATASRQIEHTAMAAAAPHALMEAAGLAVARLALAMAPDARQIWVAAGPGNNGGDGLVAARWLISAGKSVHITWQGQAERLPRDAAHARKQVRSAGAHLHAPDALPHVDGGAPQLVIDALLGLGQRRAPDGDMARSIEAMNDCRRRGARLLAIDVPTGLCGDTGRRLGNHLVEADATLTLLTAKPGLFTADGRDAAGDIWHDDLGVALDATPIARLSGVSDAKAALAPRLRAAHASHKGRFGDVWVVGGATGMVGAAHLAARASLRAGAGRVYLSVLADEPLPSPISPELMQRSWADARAEALADQATVVCGCGGGDAVRRVLPELIRRARRLVLDADALNAIAADTMLASMLAARGRRGVSTVLTPHPLEAARLLDATAAEVQLDRLGAARRLAERFGAVVLLKGSGSVIAAPGAVTAINSTGSARLATAGTGDVLAGWIGGSWSGHPESDALAAMRVASGSAWLHGRAAGSSAGRAGGLPLPANLLIDSMARLADSL
jgi:ADP-dependent NAD(P)H-hydrate dehydratase / NAD(P)H-hydrate epimerase